MIQLTSLLASSHGPVRPALLASGSASSFALALGALALPRAALPAADSEGEGRPAERQMLAEAGKDLPDLAPVADSDGDAGDTPPDGADIAYAWFATAPVPAPLPVALGVPVAAPALGIAAETRAERPGAAALPDSSGVAPPQYEANPVSETLAAPTEKEAAPPSVAHVPAAPVVASIAAPVTVPLVEAVARVAGPRAQSDHAPKPVPVEAAAPDRPVPAATSATLGPITSDPTPPPASDRPVLRSAAGAMVSDPGPAAADLTTPPVLDQSGRQAGARAERPVQPAQESRGQARTSEPLRVAVANAPPLSLLPPAIDGAVLASAPALPALRRAPIEPVAVALISAGADDVRAPAVAAAADVQQGAIDMRRQEWIGKMVDQIEALRDAAPVRETRLSLAPEALGKVEVSIRQEGDRVHVHFATETQAARQLIADAQPRLGELAEARGIKLGQTSFESGTAGQGPNRDSRDHPAPQQSRPPRPANPDSAVGTADDDRIA